MIVSNLVTIPSELFHTSEFVLEVSGAAVNHPPVQTLHHLPGHCGSGDVADAEGVGDDVAEGVGEGDIYGILLDRHTVLALWNIE